MSYDLAVWEGERPTDSGDAGQIFLRMYDRYIGGEMSPPTPKIAGFVQALLAEYPDLTELDDDQVDESPWADGPLIGDASGPLLYFGVVNSRSDEMQSLVATKAREHGLVCFDPQAEEVLA